MMTETEAGNGLVQGLLTPAAYPEKTADVELRETHISWVFLTDRFAYKLKKPVRFEFLDFSTVEARRRACLNELRLNKRWSQGVYLDVVPVWKNPLGEIVMGSAGAETAAGRVIDWAVKMRRLDDRLRLDRRIVEKTLSDSERRRIVRLLADTYSRLPPLSVRADEYRMRVEAHVRGNWRDLARAVGILPSLQVRRSQGQQWRWLKLFGEVLEDRARNGRIVDGHGDLRPDHVYLEDPPAIIDCIEFSDEYRRVDALDDLAFLAMDCKVLGETRLGEQLVEAYRRSAGDDFRFDLFWFYVAYRASVRAKVNFLRSQQNDGKAGRAALQQAVVYLQQADAAAAKLLPPVMVVMRGVSGSGKSTLGQELASELALERIGTDELRRELFAGDSEPQAWETGRYTAEARDRVYQALLRRASQKLGLGLSVLLDGTFLSRRHCEEAEALARQYEAEWLFVECRCPEDVLRKRLEQRVPGQDAASEANWDVARRQLRLFESVAQPARVAVDTTASFPEQIAKVKAHLRNAVRQALADESR